MSNLAFRSLILLHTLNFHHGLCYYIPTIDSHHRLPLIPIIGCAHGIFVIFLLYIFYTHHRSYFIYYSHHGYYYFYSHHGLCGLHMYIFYSRHIIIPIVYISIPIVYFLFPSWVVYVYFYSHHGLCMYISIPIMGCVCIFSIPVTGPAEAWSGKNYSKMFLFLCEQ